MRHHLLLATLVHEGFEVAVARLIELVLLKVIIIVVGALELVLDNIIDGRVSKVVDDANNKRNLTDVFETSEDAV